MKAFQAWTPARVGELERLWNAGYTANKIAELMDLPGGKNAIIGKAHRMKLERRNATLTRSREEYKRIREERAALSSLRVKRVRINNNALGRNQFQKVRTPPATNLPVAVPIPSQEPASRNVLFAKRLTNLECAWIAGEPNALATCCGVRCRAGSQYCIFHHSIVWRPPETRAR